ncbi:MAG: phosphohistidine phosphatase SixA [Actinomycetota bacterium]
MSIDLYVVRHGIAHDADPGEWPDDDERPLTKDGIASFKRAASALSKKKIDKLFTSPLVRSEQTAKILTTEAGWPHAEELKDLRPEMPATTVVQALKSITSDGMAVGIVGHEPQLSGVIQELTGARVDLRKGGVARIEVRTLAKGGGVLRWLVTQKILRS